MKMIAQTFVALVCFVTVGLTQAQANSAKPPMQRLKHEAGKIAYSVKVRPGVPDAGTTVILEIELAEILATPDPRFGRHKPINDADLHVVLVGPQDPAPAAKKKAAAAKPWLASHKGVRLSDPGTYGVSFLGPKDGVYGAYIRGSAGAAGNLDYAFALPFGVWPVATEQALPALPKELPSPAAGDLASGQALCAKYCRVDLEHTSPNGATPTFLNSEYGASLGDQQLLATLTKDGGKTLSPSERANLLHYLRSIHMTVRDFFPEAAAYMAAPMTINEYGLERLKDSGHAIAASAAKGVVIVVYKAAGESQAPKSASLIPYSDTIARDRLDKGDRIGYLVFTQLAGEKAAYELAIAMEREPGYVIKELRARAADGSQSPKLNATLKHFHGQGAFNDAKSLKGGDAKVRQKLVAAFLRAAELATAYFGEERQFTEFDGAF